MRPVTLEPADDTPAVSAQLFQRLLEFSEAQIGPRHTREFALTVRGEDGQILGGLTGELIWNALYVGVLWVSELSRRQGYGSALMQSAEDMARERGCQVSFLSTMTFQAPDFYKRLGYLPIGELPDSPKGFSRVWLAKRLDEQQTP
jgi:GNAT superfamily N-acetyltransferase